MKERKEHTEHSLSPKRTTHYTQQVAQLARANGSEIDESKPYAELW